MPRNVRNFWIELDVDGRKERVAAGPRSKDGGFTLNLFIRNEGGVEHKLSIMGHPISPDGLRLSVHEIVETEYGRGSYEVAAYETVR